MKVADSEDRHWVNRAPDGMRPYLQLSRLDRPVGYWLLALPGWMGLAFPAWICRPGWSGASAIIWGALILIGAIAMRGAGCTYNDIIDRELDAQVERTRSRPLPSGAVSLRQAWIWLFAQIGIGFAVWLCLPMGAKLVALASIPLVAAYPFMKRITWWPQIWLGLTFNWAFLVAYTIKTGGLTLPAILTYLGLACWTVGYDTIYALQDAEDDALIGVKSTARRMEGWLEWGIAGFYGGTVGLIGAALVLTSPRFAIVAHIPFAAHLVWQVMILRGDSERRQALRLFKSNIWAAALFWLALLGVAALPV